MAKAEAAVKKKIKEDRINSLYDKYGESEFFADLGVDGFKSKTVEEKAQWLENNIDNTKAAGDGRDSPWLSLGDALTFDYFELDEERHSQIEINKNQELKDFNYSRANDKYVSSVEEINADDTLSAEERSAKLKELKPAPLIIENEKEIEIDDIDVEFDSLANTLLGKDATLEMFNGNEQKLKDYNTYTGFNDLLTDITDSSLNTGVRGIKGKHRKNPDYNPNKPNISFVGESWNPRKDYNPKYLTPLDLYIKEYGIPTYEEIGRAHV